MSGNKSAANLSMCYVDPNGKIVCPHTASGSLDRQTKTAVKRALPADVGPKRLDLIAKLIKRVMDSKLDDDCIGYRSDDAADSVELVLAKPAPIMALYKYSTLPGNIMATFYVNKSDFGDAHNAMNDFASPKPPC